jgi:FixJ family two-component response regulator
MKAPAATVYIIDDDSEVRRALAPGARAVSYEIRTFGSATEFLAVHDVNRTGCLILDVAASNLDDLEFLIGSGCRLPIILLAGNGDIPTSVRAMRAGAVNFLAKPVEGERLFAAVEEALRIDAERRIERSLRQALEERLAMLTPRERQVFEQVAAGRLNKQIAADLGTVEQTVKVHRGRLMRKMGAHSIAELVWLFARAGITQMPVPERSPPADFH